MPNREDRSLLHDGDLSDDVQIKFLPFLAMGVRGEGDAPPTPGWRSLHVEFWRVGILNFNRLPNSCPKEPSRDVSLHERGLLSVILSCS